MRNRLLVVVSRVPWPRLTAPFAHCHHSWGTSFGEEGFIRVQRFGENPPCAEDTAPSDGDGCNNGPPEVLVCGSCGILYDSTYPAARPAQS